LIALTSDRRLAEQQTAQEIPLLSKQAPSKPGRPVVECDRGIYVTLEWTGPEDDGGADVTGYVIKYGRHDDDTADDDDSDESTVVDDDGHEHTNEDDYATEEVAGDTTHFQFTHQLEQLTIYRFAVAAVNTAGQGEFSEFSDDIRTDYGKQCHLIDVLNSSSSMFNLA